MLPSRSVSYIDNDVTVQSHMTKTVSGCFAVLRQLRNIRRSLPDSVYQSLVVALVNAPPRLR